MARMSPNITFFLAYAGLGALAFIALDQVDSKELARILAWLVPVVTAPLAIQVARRAGAVSTTGVAIAAVTLAACVCIATVGVFVAIAVPAVGAIGPGYVARAFRRYFTLGGWPLLLDYGFLIVSPLAWAALLRGRQSANRGAAS